MMIFFPFDSDLLNEGHSTAALKTLASQTTQRLGQKTVSSKGQYITT